MQHAREKITTILKRADNLPVTTPKLSSQLRQYRSILITLLVMPLALFMDSPAGDSILIYGQAIVDFLVFLYFIKIYTRSSHRMKQMLLIGMVVGYGMEILGSLILGWYHYRFWNVPLWLAFGHGIILWAVSKMSNIVWLKSARFQYGLLALILSYGTIWLYAAQDWFGFLCMLAFLVVFFAIKKFRLFLLLMFIVVAYIEQIGSITGCWHWSAMVMGIPSGNPPSGIMFFYLVFNIGVILTYIILNLRTTKRYMRLHFSKKDINSDPVT